MKRVLFLESALWSRLVDPPTSRSRRITEAFLREVVLHHRALTSRLVIGELWETPQPAKRDELLDRVLAAKPEILSLGRWARKMAWDLVRAGRWSSARFVDMLHVSYTVLAEADALVTWDVRDLARERTRTVVHAYARRKGLPAPLIGTPEEVAEWLDLRIRWPK